jgi:C4-type Zn-finger protein
MAVQGGFVEEACSYRHTVFNMADKIKSGRASVLVQVTDPSGKVIVERSMYLNNKGAGTDTIGAFSD